MKLFCETSSIFELDNIQNEAILRDFLNFWTWQHQKRSNSARLPSKMESWVQSWWPRTNAFCDFSSCVSKVLRLPGKSEARSYKVLHLSRKIIFPNLKISCSKMQPSQEISALTSQHLSWTCLLYCACHAKCIFPVSRACHRFWKCYKTLTFCSLLTRRTIPCACHGKRHLNVQKCSVPLCFFHFWLGNVLRATTACAFSTCQLPKVVRAWRALCILTSKRASRHNGVHFFDISTSKTAPNPSVFNTFYFQMCFAPQRRALFQHLNFQKCSETASF